MRFLFCSDPWNARLPDPLYESELAAVKKLDLGYSLIDFESLVEQRNPQRSVRRVEPATSQRELAIYRGWMLKPEVYELLYKALAEKNIFLINTPEAYKHCHYLPESYPAIEAHTPASIWLRTGPEAVLDDIMRALQPFGEKAIIVKDFVKSRKHEWYEACYIPSASNRSEVERVVTRFLQLQGDDLNEGLVFREFVQFEPLASHAKSAMPLTKEFRLFFLDGQLLLSTPYWEQENYGDETLPLALFTEVAQQVQSRFFTMDVAKQLQGTWQIVELGDGQVAGLPDHLDRNVFYQGLTERVLQ